MNEMNMQTKEPLSCPIDGTIVNENVARTIAVFVIVLAGISLVFNLYSITLFLVFDFAARAFLEGKFSLLKLLSIEVTRMFKIKAKPTDGAPKKFAALLGFIFVNIIFVLQYFNFQQTAVIVGLLLIICAALEGFLGFCVGCVMYQFLQKLK